MHDILLCFTIHLVDVVEAVEGGGVQDRVAVGVPHLEQPGQLLLDLLDQPPLSAIIPFRSTLLELVLLLLQNACKQGNFQTFA